jgi:DNA gyrase subunit B
MPNLITDGYVYIAQPPLYKIKQGGKETYAKDENEFEKTILARGMEKTKCSFNGEKIEGVKLAERVDKLKVVERYLRNAQLDGVDRNITLTLMATDICKREDFTKREKIDKAAKRLERAGYSVEFKMDREHNLYVIYAKSEQKTVNINYEMCSQGDYIEAHNAYKKIERFYEEGVSISNGEKKSEALHAAEFLKYIVEKGKEGITIQRYKGLGEMNPEQLWQTTMNPEKRSLVRVSIEDAVEADQVFTVLMGDNIEKRRQFIEENALNVSNLDI